MHSRYPFFVSIFMYYSFDTHQPSSSSSSSFEKEKKNTSIEMHAIVAVMRSDQTRSDETGYT